MHFFTKAAFCSMGIFSRIALSSQARIFAASLRGSIFSGAVDFMLVASAGGEAKSMHKHKPNRIVSVWRMAASHTRPMR